MRKWNPSNSWLQKNFRKYNKAYFDNDLPKETLIIWRRPFVKGHAAEFVTFKDGSLLILINPILKRIGAENYILQSLLHEMCHLSLYAQGKKGRVYTAHGKLFHAEMMKLVHKGAFFSLW